MTNQKDQGSRFSGECTVSSWGALSPTTISPGPVEWPNWLVNITGHRTGWPIRGDTKRYLPSWQSDSPASPYTSASKLRGFVLLSDVPALCARSGLCSSWSPSCIQHRSGPHWIGKTDWRRKTITGYLQANHLEVQQCTWISCTEGCLGSSRSLLPPHCSPSLLASKNLDLLGDDEHRAHTMSVLPSKRQCQPAKEVHRNFNCILCHCPAWTNVAGLSMLAQTRAPPSSPSQLPPSSSPPAEQTEDSWRWRLKSDFDPEASFSCCWQVFLSRRETWAFF